MSESSKPPFLWIFIAGMILLFITNHWMSKEIGRSAVAKQPAPIAEETTEIAEAPVLRVPEPVVFDPVKKKRVQKKKPTKDASVEEAFGPSEPIYEPPGNSTILVQ